MQTRNPFLDDMARVASGAISTLGAVRGEVEAKLREQFERRLRDMDLVTREEFQAIQAMAETARREQEALVKRVAALETKLADRT